MKKWPILAPLGLAAGAAAALVLLKKKPAEKAAAPKAAPPKAAPKAPANLKQGSYSFISGFQNAATVDMSLDYDSDAFSFAVVEEGFLSSSSDSHVALLEGEGFSMQFEYAAYLSGEEADGRWSVLREKHPELAPVRCGGLDAVYCLEGDAVCYCLPIPEDASSYVLVSLFKAKDNDTELADMPKDPDVTAILDSVRFERS